MKSVLLSLALLFLLWNTNAQTVGLFQNTPASFNGYTLFSSCFGKTTYLIDNCGKQVHQWTGAFSYSRSSVYLLPNGDLIRSGTAGNSFGSAAASGAFEKLDWNGNVLWSYVLSDSNQSAHHDFTVMPNGNILAVVWEKLTPAQLIANGRNPAQMTSSFWTDKILELTPVGNDSAAIVWEWKAWDHLIQDFSSLEGNYGVVKDHPELIDINLVPGAAGSWMHVNSVDYNPELDQIIFSARNFSEFMIIDHSTTTAEAAGHTGGKRGRGGDILYRWGNPQNYGRGTAADRKLFQQHDAKWIKAGLPKAGNILVFNNGIDRVGLKYSTVEIVRPPLLPDSSYHIVSNQAYDPLSTDWSYPAQPDTNFYSATMGGASMQPNGNVLICEATLGEFIEVDSMGNSTWEYVSPLHPTGVLTQGATGNNGVFKISRYASDYPGLAAQSLIPGLPIEINPLPYNCTIYTVDGVDDIQVSEKSVINVFPNPGRELVTISLKATKAGRWNLRLTDVSGKVVLEGAYFLHPGENELRMDWSALSNGCYLLQAANNTEQMRQMIVIN